MRTGLKARQRREKKLPNEDILNALADIFSKNPSSARDIFTSSVCAMLLCAPSRISEILTLPEDCEVWQTKRDGTKAYGWRFQPGKGGATCIKWIPNAMVSIAQEAIARIRGLTDEARKIAQWYEDHPHQFYRHQQCPDVAEEEPLDIRQTGLALGIPINNPSYCRAELRRFDLSDKPGKNTLNILHQWTKAKLPRNFPWFDKERGIRFQKPFFACRLNNYERICQEVRF